VKVIKKEFKEYKESEECKERKRGETCRAVGLAKAETRIVRC
jgi:hypothetical protein